MSELPKVTSEELYRSLYEKTLKEKNDLLTQVTTMEIMATKLRDQRDKAYQKLQDDNAYVDTPAQDILEPDEIIE